MTSQALADICCVSAGCAIAAFVFVIAAGLRVLGADRAALLPGALGDHRAALPQCHCQDNRACTFNLVVFFFLPSPSSLSSLRFSGLRPLTRRRRSLAVAMPLWAEESKERLELPRLLYPMDLWYASGVEGGQNNPKSLACKPILCRAVELATGPMGGQFRAARQCQQPPDNGRAIGVAAGDLAVGKRSRSNKFSTLKP